MKTDNLKELFDELDFDLAQPAEDHELRFQRKLKTKPRKKLKKSGVFTLWAPAMAIAASFLMAFLLFPGLLGNDLNQTQELAQVSPEMKQTQDFYSTAIQNELENLQEQKNPATEAVIDDALKQLSILESDYQKLTQDLQKSGQDERVIYAMITNFQKRIDLLKNVLEKVNHINTLKNTPHENNII